MKKEPFDALWADCETDEERRDFLLSGRAVATGIIAPAIVNDVAMAFHFRAGIMEERRKASEAPHA
jgi:hypothetical protein